MRIFLCGVPYSLGGGNREAYDTAMLWRRAGIEVTCLWFEGCHCGRPTVKPLESNPFIPRLRAAGVQFAGCQPGRLSEIDGLPGAVLVSFGCSHTLHLWPEFARLGCRLVWSPLMCCPCSDENKAFLQVPPTAVHFQSRYQQSQIQDQYVRWGCRRVAMIHGAFEPLAFRPLVHQAGEPLVVGRLARACPTKWTPYLWKMLGAVRDAGVDLRALCMGWSSELSRHCGEPPAWATCLAAETIPAEAFLSRCHVMIAPNYGVNENWPRIGLECLSAGVPLVVDNRGGWQEQLEGAGLFCDTLGDYPLALKSLAGDEPYRQSLIRWGRQRLSEIASPQPISRKWGSLLESLASHPA